VAQYQDAYYAGTVSAGVRECARRWEFIEPFAPQSGIVLDVGSNLGYFGIRIALRSEQVAVVSIEANQTNAEEQARIVQSHGLTRLCVINAAFNSRVAADWAQACDWFDLTLLLSIIHWFDDPAAVVRDLSGMSARMIIEIPDAEDHGACGQTHLKEWRDPLDWTRKVTGRHCTLIGRGERHTSEAASHIILVEGPVSRRPARAYWDSQYAHPSGNDYELQYDGAQLTFSVRGKRIDYVPGVNLLSLMKLGRLVWPQPNHWVRLGISEIRRCAAHKDPAPHNMIWTPGGLHLIDGDDRRGDAIGSAAERVLRRNIAAWWKNESTSPFAYVPRRSEFERKVARWRKQVRRGARSLAGALIPEPITRKLRQIFPYR
jgi:SAM-dependent methyltransferase